MKRGLTLIELVITIVMFAILAGTAFYIFRVVLINWSIGERRTGIDITLDRAIEEVVRELREARAVQSTNPDELRFTDISDNSFIYYLYNAEDAYPPAFNESSYELRRADLDPDIDGLLVDSGDIIMMDVLPPATSDLSISGNVVTIDLTIEREDETIRSRTQVRPRNL